VDCKSIRKAYVLLGSKLFDLWSCLFSNESQNALIPCAYIILLGGQIQLGSVCDRNLNCHSKETAS